MAAEVLESIRRLLRESGVPFREVHHEPTRTSEESARARGESIEIGGKALLMKVGEPVLPPDPPDPEWMMAEVERRVRLLAGAD